MPLSEEEQRILHEIESQFYANDPELAHQVAETTLYRHGAGKIRLAAIGFVVGLVILLVTFANSPILGFVGVLVMFVSLVVGVATTRTLGRAGLASIEASMSGASIRGVLGNSGTAWRTRRFRSGG